MNSYPQVSTEMNIKFYCIHKFRRSLYLLKPIVKTVKNTRLKQNVFCKCNNWHRLFSMIMLVTWYILRERSNTSQSSSVAQSCPTLCDPMNRSTPGFPVHHQLPELTQTHVRRADDVIQPSHPLLSPSHPSRVKKS